MNEIFPITKPTLTEAGVPTDAGGSLTTWIYFPNGQLQQKQDATGKGATYTYTDAGRLKTRTWERTISATDSTKVKTEYGYTNGLITTVTYNDGTPNLEYTYDALGRQDTVKRGGVLHADYGYRSDTLALETERLQIDTLDKTLTRTYEDGTNGTLKGRPSGYTFTGASATWGYDNAGRLSTISDGTDTFTYGYRYVVNGAIHEGSTAVNSIESAMPFTLAGPKVTTTLAYEATRNVLASRQNSLTGGTLSKFTYVVNAIGQRETVTTSGDDAFGTNPANWTWGYDSLGQVISADSPTTTSDRGYLYDSIGNRRGIRNGAVGVPTEADGSITAGQGTLTYDVNPLNQYSSVPQATAAPVFDLDGNMTNGPVPGTAGQTPGIHAPTDAQLTWDAENRLVKAVVAGTTVNYAYDHLSRLISRSVGVSPTTVTHYLYDGWNRIAEYESNGTGHDLKSIYLWGMDLSGTMQGAGGVGGPLSVSRDGGVFYPTFDGNGNVSEYVNQAGVKVAHFEYDPFGNLTVDSENNAASFPYRFSTKPQDPTTGLLYYGYRWYDPATGRWPSRDPIGDRGGINLYGFVRNDGVLKIDYLGLANSRTAWIPIMDDVILYEWDIKQYLFIFSEHESDNENCVYRMSSRTNHHTVKGTVVAEFRANNDGIVIDHIKDEIFEELRDKISDRFKGNIGLTWDVVIGGIRESLKNGSEIPDGYTATTRVAASGNNELIDHGNWSDPMLGHIFKDARSKVPPCKCPEIPMRTGSPLNKKEYYKDPLKPW